MRTCPKCHGEVLIDGKALTRIVSEPPEIAALRAALAEAQRERDGLRQEALAEEYAHEATTEALAEARVEVKALQAQWAPAEEFSKAQRLALTAAESSLAQALLAKDRAIQRANSESARADKADAALAEAQGEVERLTCWRAALEATENYDNSVLLHERDAALVELERLTRERNAWRATAELLKEAK